MEFIVGKLVLRLVFLHILLFSLASLNEPMLYKNVIIRGCYNGLTVIMDTVWCDSYLHYNSYTEHLEFSV